MKKVRPDIRSVRLSFYWGDRNFQGLNALERAGIYTLGEAASFTEAQLLDKPRVWQATVTRVKEILVEHNLGFR